MDDKLVRLSDVTGLLWKIEKLYHETYVSNVRADMVAHCIDQIKTIPAVDAVEVVRCRECQFNPKHEWTGCPKAGTWREFNYDGFCSDGQRREEEHNG